MTRVLPLLSPRAARGAVVVAFLLGSAAPCAAQTQDEPPLEPSMADSTAAEPAPLETIPVDGAETPPASDSPEYPYTFAAARLSHTEADDRATEGIGISGSYLLLPNVYGVASAFFGETDEDTDAIEISRYEIGAGYRHALGASMDLNVGLRMLQESESDSAAKRNELGYRFDAGVRATLLPKLEAGAALWYVDAANSSHGYLAGSALYEVLPRLGVGAEAVLGSDTTSYSLVGRWAF